MSLISQIENTFKSQQLDLTTSRLLLAVSGGKDSMVLLSLLKSLGVSFEVAHMNYQLRNQDSDLDEQLVRRICKENRIICHIIKVDTKTYCADNKLSTQEGARVLRYNWFEKLLKTQSLDFITTAHHDSDNHETFFQNLKRGSGLRGLKSMVFLQNKRCKPLLTFTREQIDTYAVSENIEYRQDASNNQNHYQRNLIRNKVLPEIENHLPGFKQGLSKSIGYLQNDYEYLIQSLEKESQEITKLKGDSFLITEYKNHHPRLILHILEKYGFNESQCQDILNASQSGRAVLNEAFGVTINDGNLIIHPLKIHLAFQLSVPTVGKYELGNSVLAIAETEKPKVFTSDKNVAWIDSDLIKFPIEVRTWKAGDRFQPLGMKGSKKISDFLTDLKIPLNEKDSVKLLISNGEIVWVVGLAVSERYKITQNTKKVLKLETI